MKIFSSPGSKHDLIFNFKRSVIDGCQYVRFTLSLPKAETYLPRGLSPELISLTAIGFQQIVSR